MKIILILVIIKAMRALVLSKNYTIIWNTFLKYLPSRFFVILNSMIIIPFLAHLLTSKEMGIFQVCIVILNLVCTCSTDWVAKSVLRFWVKYKKKDEQEKFLSSVLFLTVITYAMTLIIYFCFSDFICSKIFIDKKILLLTLFLVIPCGIRQLLYQILRIFNKPFLYTFSIIIYQFFLLCLFLLFSYRLNNVVALLEAMALGILFIDLYIIKQINLNIKLHFNLDSDIIKENLKYGLPLIITTVGFWTIFHANKFIFQYNHLFLDTAIAGIGLYFTTNILNPIFSTFLFSIFPTIVKKFERQSFIKPFVTNTIQLYFALFVPLVGVFCLFSTEITKLFLSQKYIEARILLPFFAVSIFFHELNKLINVKYHLRNKTYIEMVLTFLVGWLSLALNIFLIPKFGLLAVGLILLFSIILLIILNSMINFRSIDCIEPKKVFKTAFITALISILCFLIIALLSKDIDFNQYFGGTKLIMFLGLSYFISWQFRAKILE